MKISIIVPIIDEEKILPKFFNQMSELPFHELIMVDGGSSDQTTQIILNYIQQFGNNHVHLVSSNKSRSIQMNKGAEFSSGDVLLFLHADTLISREAFDYLSKLNSNAYFFGAFQFSINLSDSKYRWLEKMVHLRNILFHLPFGDQGIFVSKITWNLLGGYQPIELMEDVEFVRRYKKQVEYIYLKHKAITNGRRWEKKGIVRNSGKNLMLQLLFFVGVSPKRLGKWYYES